MATNSLPPTATAAWTTPTVLARKSTKVRNFVSSVSIYLTEEQFNELTLRAKNKHQTKSRCARQALMRALRRALPAHIEARVLGAIEEVLLELRDLRMGQVRSSEAGMALDRALDKLGGARDVVRQVKASRAAKQNSSPKHQPK